MAIDREEVEKLLSAAQQAQTEYWDAVRELEGEIDRDLDGEDLSMYDVDSILEAGEPASEESAKAAWEFWVHKDGDESDIPY